MNLGVASRFAILKLEGDEPEVKETPKSPEKKNKVDKNKKKDSQSTSKKPSTSGASKKKKKKNVVNSGNQWEEWKNVDKKQVSEFYEDDLQQALLLSKIDSEKNDKEDIGNSSNNSKKKKKDVKQTLSLDQFNEMSAHQIDQFSSNDSPREDHLVAANDSQFFKNIEKDAEKILSQELRKDSIKDRSTFLADCAVSLQVQKELDKKDARIAALEIKVKELKEKYTSLRTQHKHLICILAQAETKEKAQILAQNQQLQQIKDELSEEVATLHVALEQEKSKVHRLR
ncbi:G kinase-anchoring protein 1 [Nymphon striatum]|nr:G kinase-anchoring protein 1 [Nymphon striatum]